MRELQFLDQYYSNYDENERLLNKYGQIEYLTTMRYINQYLIPKAKILEIGAGTGRYSHTLARQGYEVHAIELIQSNIEQFNKNTTPDENITIQQGDALDLSSLSDETFDLTLLLGPMYHLYTDEHKQQAYAEALRVTKKGGILCTAYCNSDASIITYGFLEGHIFELIEKKMIDLTTFETYSKPEDLFELCRKEDIDKLIANFDVTRLHYVATDLYTKYFQDAIAEMTDEMFALYLQYHFAVCERPDMVGISHHTLDVVKKNC